MRLANGKVLETEICPSCNQEVVDVVPIAEDRHFPVRVFPAKTLRITAIDTALIDINLGYGSHVHRYTVIEGLDRKMVPRFQVERTFTLLTQLIGGKRLLIETCDFRPEGAFLARVFLDDAPINFNPPGYSHPSGFEEKKLEVGTFLRHIIQEGLDSRLMWAYINGKVHPAIESQVKK